MKWTNLFLGSAVVFITVIVRGQETSVKQISISKENTRDEVFYYPLLVNKFYLLSGNKLSWMSTESKKQALRSQLIQCMDSAYYSGLSERLYHREELAFYAAGTITDSVSQQKADHIYTDAAIALSKDIFQGYKMKPWVGYDQLSAKYEETDNEWLLQRLLQATTSDQILSFLEQLEPAQNAYKALKQEFKVQQQKGHTDTVAILKLSMDYYRWIHHFHFDKLIVVNLPEARLGYYEKDSLILNMKTVVGKTSTPTPRFATFCDQVILYPYWYVPRSITFNEYLPRIKKNPSWIDENNMQVIDGAGKIMDHQKMNWSLYHTGYFPYTIRQSTGCDNALGVIKFNILSPYGVYLHDTNNKTAFLSGLRFYSHGCIRIEEPFELADKVMEEKLDTAYLQSCFKDQKPKFINLKNPVPVFSVYMQAVPDPKGNIRYYKDIYQLTR